jgi:menaquinol-cytochrome c reductase iron-sulfur subunit
MESRNSDSALALDRRSVLVKAVYGAFALVCAALGIPAAAYLLSPPKDKGQAQWINAGDLHDFMPESPQTVRFQLNRTGWKTSGEEASTWVVNQGGQVTAFSPWCTHLGCLYRWQEAQHQFFCPCHGSRFAIDGKVIAGPAPRPLDQWEVRIEDSQVWVRPTLDPEAARS